jgi:hypothetical protein
MKRLVIVFLLTVASALAQLLPSGVTVFTVHESGALLSTFLPLPVPLINMDLFEVFVSTTNPDTTGFTVRIQVTNGGVTTTQGMTIDRTHQQQSLAEFWVPAGATVRAASVVEVYGTWNQRAAAEGCQTKLATGISLRN